MGWSTKKLNWDNPRVYRCSKCGGSDHFVSGKEKRRICKPCHHQSNEKWRKANPEKHNKKYRNPQGEFKVKLKEYRKNWALKKRYGITLNQYNSLVKYQNGQCLICKGNQNLRRPLAVDHCHKTGKIRGLLCDPCNIGLAFFRDNKSSLAQAIKYLESAPHAICLAALKTLKERK